MLFGSESWAMSEATTRAVERTNINFLRRITGKRERRKYIQDVGKTDTHIGVEGI